MEAIISQHEEVRVLRVYVHFISLSFYHTKCPGIIHHISELFLPEMSNLHTKVL